MGLGVKQENVIQVVVSNCGLLPCLKPWTVIVYTFLGVLATFKISFLDIFTEVSAETPVE